ncbi:protein ALP1-like [Cucumis melo]|uniref:Protein ALP1-like n=1 Tax=Cucumis melo TaxID=3656 RepID=A0ABM3KUQ2_CUCME|nr:protein ALP1-like [Cucumis melo]
MDRRCFAILCHLLRTIPGLTSTEVVDVEEMVAMFLHILAHDVKNRVIQREFMRSGYYYLVDAGYPNAEGFLAPYRGQRYHLQEWRGPENAPSTSKEFFNMKHSSARNVIERAFGVLKGRWAILRGKSYYPVEVQCRTILACCLLHNLINREMTNFDIEDNIDKHDKFIETT